MSDLPPLFDQEARPPPEEEFNPNASALADLWRRLPPWLRFLAIVLFPSTGVGYLLAPRVTNRMLAIGCGLLVLWQFGNSLLRLLSPKCRPSWSLFARSNMWGLVCPAGLGLWAWSEPPRGVSLLEVGLLTFFLLVYVDTELACLESLGEDQERGTTIVGKSKILSFLSGRPGDLTTAAARPSSEAPQQVLGWLFQSVPVGQLSPLRRLLVAVLTALCLLLAASVAVSYVRHNQVGRPKQMRTRPRHHHGSPHPGPKGLTVPTGNAREGTGGGSSSSNGSGGSSECNTLAPGAGLDETTRTVLLRLYQGAPEPYAYTDRPPGFTVGGCPGSLYTPDGQSRSVFQYVIGTTSDGTERSIAVISARFGPAIFMAPAVQPIQQWINRYEDLGGLRQINIGNGDMYPVLTPMGLAVLLRPTKTLRAFSDLATPYVPLVPAAAKAWADLSISAGRVLWARQLVVNSGADRIGLFPTAGDALPYARGASPVHTLTVYPDGRVRVDDKPGTVGPEGQLQAAALAQLKALAPPPKARTT